MSYPEYNGEGDYGSKFSVTAVAARVVTMASLIVSVAVLQTNDATVENGYVNTYNDFHSYKYIFYVMIFGLAYTVLQIPFAVYYMLRKKHLINSYRFLKFDFYADLIVGFLLATGAGAAFGATMDLNSKNIKWYDDKEMQDFFTVAYIPPAFLLVGSIASAISVVHSSQALTKP